MLDCMSICYEEDNGNFLSDRLIKKTTSVTIHHLTHYLVSYYLEKDVVTGKLQKPSENETLRDIKLRSELFLSC